MKEFIKQIARSLIKDEIIDYENSIKEIENVLETTQTSLKSVQKDYKDVASIEIMDFSEFLINHIKVVKTNNNAEVKK